MRVSPVLFAALVVALPAALAATSEEGGASAPRPLTVDDTFRLGEVEDPQISPDGEWVAYTVTVLDLEEDEERSRIWMVPAAGGEAVPMTVEGSSAWRPRWSPDGSHLAFLAERDDDEAQVWTLFRHGGDSVRVTDVIQGVDSYEWSPEGGRMVLVIRDPRPDELEKKEKTDKGEGCEEDDEPRPPWVITRRQFKEDYTGYLERYRDHLYLLDLSTREMRQITSGDHDDSEPAWSPDGQRIAFVSNRGENPDSDYNSDIWVVAADSPDGGGKLLRITTNPGADAAPVWSPDGERIAHLSATDPGAIVYATNHLAVSRARGGETRVLTERLDRNVFRPRFAPDGRSLYFIWEDSGEQRLVRMPVGGGRLETVVGGTHVVEEFAIGADGQIVALVTEPHLPPEVHRVDGSGLVRLTHTNDEVLAGLRLGEMEKIRFRSADGTEIEGFAVKPPGFDPSIRYPTVLWIHGGPMAQYDWRFDIESQIFAANGYLVLLSNPRGSTGYGQPFTLAIWQAWGEKDYEDVVAAVDWAIERGWADPERLAVGGWSYGGMLTNHVITRTDRFRAAITGASAALYVVNYGHDQYQRWWEYELGLPWEEGARELYERLSPFNRVEKIVTPTLIVGGKEDWNVPIINSEQLFLALERLGRTAELVVYPEQYHGFERPSYLKDLYERYLAWLERFLAPAGGVERRREEAAIPAGRASRGAARDDRRAGGAG